MEEVAGCPVDLVDVRAASTVMQYQVIATGQGLWARDRRPLVYEAAILRVKTELDTARAGVLDDIRQTGTIYER